MPTWPGTEEEKTTEISCWKVPRSRLAALRVARARKEASWQVWYRCRYCCRVSVQGVPSLTREWSTKVSCWRYFTSGASLVQETRELSRTALRYPLSDLQTRGPPCLLLYISMLLLMLCCSSVALSKSAFGRTALW